MKLILIIGYTALVFVVLTRFVMDMLRPWRERRKLRRFAQTKHLYKVAGVPTILEYDFIRSSHVHGIRYSFRSNVQEWIDEFIRHPMGVLPDIDMMEYYQTIWFDNEADMIYFKLYWHDALQRR